MEKKSTSDPKKSVTNTRPLAQVGDMGIAPMTVREILAEEIGSKLE